tara:strand:+ start:296 stop:676 length:381 start_codon:yes stop_codon:yes gene_type:complete
MSETKKRRGRPKGSGHGQSIVLRVRRELEKSLDILEGDEMPLASLLASQLKQDAAKTLNAIGKFVPSDIKIEHSGDNLIGALEQIGAAIDEQLLEAKAGQISSSSASLPDEHIELEAAENLGKKMH